VDFLGAVRVLLRRWFVALPALLLSLVLAAGVYASISPSYESRGVMVLTRSSGQSVSAEDLQRPERINPLLAFDSSLSTAAEILMQILQDPKTENSLGAEQASNTSYLVTGGALDGPFLIVDATSDSAQTSRDITQRVLDRARDSLTQWQGSLGAPEQSYIRSYVIVEPTEPKEQVGGKVRFAGATLVLGLIGTLCAAFAAESLATRRRGGRELPDLARSLAARTPAARSPDSYDDDLAQRESSDLVTNGVTGVKRVNGREPASSGSDPSTPPTPAKRRPRPKLQ